VPPQRQTANVILMSYRPGVQCDPLLVAVFCPPAGSSLCRGPRGRAAGPGRSLRLAQQFDVVDIPARCRIRPAGDDLVAPADEYLGLTVGGRAQRIFNRSPLFVGDRLGICPQGRPAEAVGRIFDATDYVIGCVGVQEALEPEPQVGEVGPAVKRIGSPAATV